MMRRALLALTLCGLLAGEAQALEPTYSDVSVSVDGDGIVLISGKTNLPLKTQLDIVLHQKTPTFQHAAIPLNYPEQSIIRVERSGFAGTFPTIYEKGLTPGDYLVTVSVRAEQPDKPLGAKNTKLSGKKIKTQGGVKTHTLRVKASFPKTLAPQALPRGAMDKWKP